MLFWENHTENNVNDGFWRGYWKHEELVGLYPVRPSER